MNRALTREVNKVKRSAAFRPIVEDAANRTLQALLFHAVYNEPRLLPRFLWVEIRRLGLQERPEGRDRAGRPQ